MNMNMFNESNLIKEKQKDEIEKYGPIEVLDIKPEKEKTEIPTLLAPGWGNTPENLKESAKVLAQERRVITVGHSRQHHNIVEVEGHKDMNLEEIHKALVLISTLEQKGIKKADGVGFSEGGLNILLTAKLFPERFRNIVLVDPAGIIGKDNIFNLAKRFITEMQSGTKDFFIKPETRKPIAIYMKEIIKYISKNPAKSYREVKAISESDFRDIIKELSKLGINISIIHGARDKVFPQEKVEKNIDYKYIKNFYSVEGGHGEIFLHPEKIMPIIGKAIDDSEGKVENN